MSEPDERPLPYGSSRVLMLATVVLAAAAAAVLAVGAQDARLLRLGLVAALWAALLGAFAAARMRRELNSGAYRAEELRTVYQLELEREVAARREHTLTVERELREQAEQVERRELAAMRAELAAMRANLERLMDGDKLGERVALRAESARLLPMPAHPNKFDDSPSFDDKRSTAAVLGAAAKTACSLSAAGSSMRAAGGAGAGSAGFGSQDLREPLQDPHRADLLPVASALPTSEWPVNGHSEAALIPREDPELRFGPGRLYRPELDAQARSAHTNGFHSNGSHSNGSHSNGSHSNGSHNNGSHNNGGGARRAAPETPAVGAQRSVHDLLAAHGVASSPRRRRSRENGLPA
ncbi:MAG: DUF6779 domain-containing protein [Pseudonocardiaceae bacterium]